MILDILTRGVSVRCEGQILLEEHQDTINSNELWDGVVSGRARGESRTFWYILKKGDAKGC